VPKEEVWEVRPGGMLVQKRSPDADPPPGGAPVPTIRVKVKFNGVYHEIYINSQASFGNNASSSVLRLCMCCSCFFLLSEFEPVNACSCRRAQEAAVGEDGPAPGRPEGGVQGQGEGLQGVPGHGRRQGPLQDGHARGPRRQGQAPPRGAPDRQGRARRQGHRPRRPRRRQARNQGAYSTALQFIRRRQWHGRRRSCPTFCLCDSQARI
jgi:hypothetical protein